MLWNKIKVRLSCSTGCQAPLQPQSLQLPRWLEAKETFLQQMSWPSAPIYAVTEGWCTELLQGQSSLRIKMVTARSGSYDADRSSFHHHSFMPNA